MVKQFQKSIRIYADTSVFGGIFDKEFETPSRVFFDAVRKSRFSLITSELVRQEIEAAPVKVQNFFFEILPIAEIAEVTGLTESQVKVYIFRARQSLKEYIKKIELVV